MKAALYQIVGAALMITVGVGLLYVAWGLLSPLSAPGLLSTYSCSPQQSADTVRMREFYRTPSGAQGCMIEFESAECGTSPVVHAPNCTFTFTASNERARLVLESAQYGEVFGVIGFKENTVFSDEWHTGRNMGPMVYDQSGDHLDFEKLSFSGPGFQEKWVNIVESPYTVIWTTAGHPNRCKNLTGGGTVCESTADVVTEIPVTEWLCEQWDYADPDYQICTLSTGRVCWGSTPVPTAQGCGGTSITVRDKNTQYPGLVEITATPFTVGAQFPQGAGAPENKFTATVKINNNQFFIDEDSFRHTIPEETHFRPFDCPIPTGYSLISETKSGVITLNELKWEPNFFCGQHPAIHVDIDRRYAQTQTTNTPYRELCNAPQNSLICSGGSYAIPLESTMTLFYVVDNSVFLCKSDEVKKVDGTCVKAIQQGLDNDGDGIIDDAFPKIWCLDTNENGVCDTNEQKCADRDSDRLCDGVVSWLCFDNNNDQVCDWSELAVNILVCNDKDNDGECDEGATGGDPILVYVGCDQLTNPCPDGYTCAPENGLCIRTDTIYTGQCSSDLNCLTDYSCEEIGTTGEKYCQREIITTEQIDCFQAGCPVGTCIGGVCVDVEFGRCPDDLNCAQYSDSQGDPLTCNTLLGLCVEKQYETQTCMDDAIDCPPDYECIETVTGTGACLRENIIFGDCSKDCRTNPSICDYSGGEICRDEDGICMKQKYSELSCDTIGCCGNRVCVNKQCVEVKAEHLDCRENQCPDGYDCVKPSVWATSYVCLQNFTTGQEVDCRFTPCPSGQVCEVQDDGEYACQSTSQPLLPGLDDPLANVPALLKYSLIGAIIILMVLLGALGYAYYTKGGKRT